MLCFKHYCRFFVIIFKISLKRDEKITCYNTDLNKVKKIRFRRIIVYTTILLLIGLAILSSVTASTRKISVNKKWRRNNLSWNDLWLYSYILLLDTDPSSICKSWCRDKKTICTVNGFYMLAGLLLNRTYIVTDGKKDIIMILKQ